MKTTKIILLILVILMTTFMFSAPTERLVGKDEPVVLDFRLYEGFRENKGAGADIVSSYYLKSLYTIPTPENVDIEKEKKALKKIFYLKDVKLIHRTGNVLKKNKWENRFQVMVINGTEFQVQLSRVSEKETDRFKVEVTEKGKSTRSLLNTEILMPSEKITSLGFESSAGKMYFLSFNRLRAPNVPPPPPKPPVPTNIPPLIRKVPPKYPPEALKEYVQGKVVLEVQLDKKGNVKKIKIVEGHPLLTEAAITAVKQWKYKAPENQVPPRSDTFNVTVTFRLRK